MFKNYFKIAFRNIIHQKVFSSINIFGLAIGMACTMLILLWVQDELSYDKFHKNADNIYLVIRENANDKMAVTSALLSPALKQELPEVENSTCIMKLPEGFNFLIQNGDKGFEENVSFAASNLFDVLSFKLKKGDPATVLKDPNSVVITEEIEKKYFGNEDAIGKPLTISGFGQKIVAKVSGILENVPSNSHLQIQIILPNDWFNPSFMNLNWTNQSFRTYIKLKNNNDVQILSSKIKACEVRHFPNQNTKILGYSLIPLTKLHLFGNDIKFFESTGDIKYVRIFLIVAIIILLIASINYMNLSTALSLKRTKEVGIKKTVGASRKSLILQFFGESLLLSFFALCFADLLVILFLPTFNQLVGKRLELSSNLPIFISISFLITVITGLISGCYPAIFLSSFQPIQILKGKMKIGSGNLFLRKGLVVFQFALSTIMIIATIVVLNQLSFIKNSNLGFDKNNLTCIKMTGEANSKYDVLKNELLRNPDILNISHSEAMASGAWTRTIGINWKGKQPNEEKPFWILHTDYNLASTYKIELSQGRFFSEQFPTDQTNAFVINEAAAKSMSLKSPLNEEIQVWGRKGKIIGVAKDFHFDSFHTAIEPLIMQIPDSNKKNQRLNMISIRFKAGTLYNSMAFIEKTWKEQMADIPFNYYFYDESLTRHYVADQRLGSIFNYFAVLSIIIACLGLFGLASLSVEQRAKEIGIRKVLGASISNITFILSKEFLIWIVVANLIAWPVAYFFMHKWLQDFAYRIELSIWVFVLSGIMALMIAIFSVGFQTIKAAIVNPVESIRYE
jgi:ABC-type antimicrobial peptide transport system permease subunit